MTDHSPRAPARVLVAVVSWNTRELLAACLSSLEPEWRAGRAEVWVVDNASEDGSAEHVAAAFPWVQLIASEVNLGFGPAINAVAARRAGARAPEWVAAANADLVLDAGALQALLTAGDADPQAGIVAPALVLADASLEHSVHPFPGLVSSLAVNLGVGRLAPALARRLTLDGAWDPSRGRRVDWAHGAFLLIRRSAFDGVGGFDPHQFLYAEDLDIAWRLHRSGWACRYEPAARVAHVRSAAISQFYGDARDFRAQRSAYAWMLRRLGGPTMRTCALINTLGAMVRAAVATSTGRHRGGEAGLAAWRLRRQARIHLDGLITSRRRLERHR